MLMATKGPDLRLPKLMQRFGNQLFAGAGLAIDHHRQVGLGHARDNPVNFLHRR